MIDGFTVMESENPVAEAEYIMKNVDFDNNGFIEFSEFVTASMDKRKMLSQDRLKAAFKIFDTNNNGSISMEEVKALLGHNGVAESDEGFTNMIKEMDIDGDGEI